MDSVIAIRGICLSKTGVTALPHFEKTSFRVMKKIFATVDRDGKILCVKLSEMDQSLFGAFDATVVYPVPNKWGKKGWTFVVPDKMPEETLKDILEAAYQEVAKIKI